MREPGSRTPHGAPQMLPSLPKPQREDAGGFTAGPRRAYTSNVDPLRRTIFFLALLFCLASVGLTRAQEPATQPPERVTEQAPAEKETAHAEPELPFQIQLLETHIRFEANGDSRKEVHTIVKINNVLGARQFARISFDYNRSFQQVEIPLVRISHANGGTSEVLPSAVTDAPNPAVEQFPAYHDVRVKSVRILGLQEDDTVEYRVITTTTKHPLAPDFWLEHTFDRSGQVLKETYELDLPASRHAGLRIAPAAPVISQETTGSGDSERTIYKWTRTYAAPADDSSSAPPTFETPSTADLGVTTLSWDYLAVRLAELMLPGSKPIEKMRGDEETMRELRHGPEVAEAVRERVRSLTKDARTDLERLRVLYQFVSSGIRAVDIPLDATGFRARSALEILDSGYATSEDKYVLFAALAAALNLRAEAVLTGFCDSAALPVPGVFKDVVVLASAAGQRYWLDPTVEVAPFGMITPTAAKCGLLLNRTFFVMDSTGHEWIAIPKALPFAAFQKVSVDASLSGEGQLSAKVKYTMRGDNELQLRVAFHQTPKEKWKDVANLLALADGFRGQVTNVVASDPLATKDPFTVEYELTQPKFVDWSKKPVRIPALLPQIGLPDAPPPAEPGKPAPKIELGTPLDVQTMMTLHLPEGTTLQTPAGAAVERDYATFASKYSSAQNSVTASRHLNFLKREIPGDRAADYNAFLHAVQNDQAQTIALTPKL